MSKWQPIETAPSDPKQRILVLGGRHKTPETVPADGEWWRLNRDLKAVPTHWMPLPELPEGQP